MNNTVNSFIQKGFSPVKSNNEYTFLKSSNGIAICYNDGKYEAFVKNNSKKLNESMINKIGAVIISTLALTYFTTDITFVNGQSMNPTYKNHSILIRSKNAKDVNKMLAKHATVRFKTPQGEQMFKRVIGVPGDEITYQGALIYINGKLVDQSNKVHLKKIQQNLIDDPSLNGHKKDAINAKTSFKLGPNEYYVLGDNRENSIDSRDYGPIQKSWIIAVVDK